MDYGVRLFRHVVAQVFGNLREAAKISAVPVIILAAVGYWAFNDFIGMAQQMQGFDANSTTLPPGFDETAAASAAGRGFLAAIVGIVVFAWVAVAWHRFVLLEEHGGGLPAFSFGRVLGYVGRSFLIGLLLILVLIPVLFVVGSLMVAAPGLGVVVAIGLNFLGGWIFVRWALILPAWSVDRRMKIGESWAATKEVSGEILVPIIGFAIIFTVLQQAVGLLPVGLVVITLSVLVGWMQMLMNLALLTTLYGNLVEGRSLN